MKSNFLVNEGTSLWKLLYQWGKKILEQISLYSYLHFDHFCSFCLIFLLLCKLYACGKQYVLVYEEVKLELGDQLGKIL